jgi:biotin synthase
MGKSYLIIAINTGQMMLVDKIMRDNGIKTEIVPALPRPGMACTKAVKISDSDLSLGKQLLTEKKVEVNSIVADEALVLGEFINSKLN